MSEFDRFLKERHPLSDTYLREQMSFSAADMHSAFAAGKAASAARISELEADCKVMAEDVWKAHASIQCEGCPACTIAKGKL